MRINKLFSNLGICSRKETNKLIKEGRVKVNGKLSVPGQWVEENDEILLDGEQVSIRKKIYIAFNKPAGIVCTAEKNVVGNIIGFLNYPQYIFPVGRLDKESEGLIIMTNDGELANEILESENNHEKEYIVTVDRDFDDEFIKKMSQGVEINGIESSGIKRVSDTLGVRVTDDKKEFIVFKEESNEVNIQPSIDKFYKHELNSVDEAFCGKINENSAEKLKHLQSPEKNTVKTRPCKVSRINECIFRIILTQGLNKQIRKMSGALGYKVIKLQRIRIMNITLDCIELGKWREINEDEVNKLRNSTFHELNKAKIKT